MGRIHEDHAKKWCCTPENPHAEPRSKVVLDSHWAPLKRALKKWQCAKNQASRYSASGTNLVDESTGTIYAAARLAGATAPPTHVLTRSIGLQGIGQLIEGIFGAAVGTTASVENVGLLGLTHVGSRRVVQISTVFMIFFSIFGKFGAFFASIPLPIFAAIYCVLYGIVAATGISFIQFANNNSMRNIYILGLSLFLGISIPQYFVMNTDPAGHGPIKTDGGWFNNIFNTIFSSPPTMAMIVATILDNTLEARNTHDDRGIPWWVPFQHKKGDSRNEEFYSFPLRFNEYIPTRFL